MFLPTRGCYGSLCFAQGRSRGGTRALRRGPHQLCPALTTSWTLFEERFALAWYTRKQYLFDYEHVARYNAESIRAFCNRHHRIERSLIACNVVVGAMYNSEAAEKATRTRAREKARQKVVTSLAPTRPTSWRKATTPRTTTRTITRTTQS